MNPFDTVTTIFINQFAHHWFILDKSIKFLSGSNLLKGGVLITIIWWLWFRNEAYPAHKREHIISTLISCIAAIAVARLLALTLPFRFRPVHEGDFRFVLPYGMSLAALDGWSSFPSDHAALFFALSVGLLFVSKKAGVFAIFYSALFISFPRVYVGLHWPTDIIGGAMIGVTFALLSNIYLVKSTRLQSIAGWSYSQPGFFYPLFFLFTYQIADIFIGSRAIAEAGLDLLQMVIF